MIEIANLGKRQGAREVLAGITATLHSGGVGLIGRNGAGKSTLLRILAGLWRPTTGSVHIGRYDVLQDDLPIRRMVGWMPEWPELHPDLRPRTLLEFAAAAHGLDAQQVEDRVERFGLGTLINRRAGVLSHGEKRAVTLALAVLHAPRVLLLDEPTNGLDPARVRALREWLQGPQRPELFVISTHQLDFVRTVARRYLILRSGHLVLDGDEETIRRQGGSEDFEQAVVRLTGD